MKIFRLVATVLAVLGWAAVAAPSAPAASDPVTTTAACGRVVFQNHLDQQVSLSYGAPGNPTPPTTFLAAGKSYELTTTLTELQFVVRSGGVIVQTSAVLKPQAGCLTLVRKAPTITGKLRVGATLTATSAGWTAGTTFTYTWFRSGKDIRGESADPTYRLTAKDKGKKITVRVRGSLAGYYSATKTSKASAKVKVGLLTAPKPTVDAAAAVGQTLTANAVWSPSPTLTYQWYRGSSKLKGETGVSHLVVAKDARAKLRVKVTGKLAGYTTVSKYSNWTEKVAG